MALHRDILCTICALLAAFTGLCAGQTGRTGCMDTRQAFRDTGFSMNEIPHSAITGDDLRVCPTGYSCCTANMESMLTQMSSTAFENVVYEKSSLLRDYFIRRTERFDNFIKELIDQSQEDLHEMFVNTYGQLYEQYIVIFEDLFRSFKNYYHGVDLDLTQVMDDFFSSLFERMFQLINPHYQYDDSFWECTSQYLTSLRPFGDVPFSLRERAKRSFVAARTFVQGLGIGRDAVTRGTKVEPTPECRKALMRMSYCPHCKGIPFVKPCYSFCLNIMKGCLASQAEMDAEWNYFIDAMTRLGSRMEGILNIETFLTTLDIEISTAIMNMQNNGVSISTKVFNGCGIPSASRQRRETNHGDDSPAPSLNSDGTTATKGPMEDVDAEGLGEEEMEEGAVEVQTVLPDDDDDDDGSKVETMNKTVDAIGKGLQGRRGQRREERRRTEGQLYRDTRPSTAAGTNLDRLIKDVLKRLRDGRPFWSVLPYMICDDSDIAEDVSVVTDCWNGGAVGRYEHELVGNGISSQDNNPEVQLSQSRPVVAVRTQKSSLDIVTHQLQRAYAGEDVEWIDNGDGDSRGSGSGSGSGSGEGSSDPDNNNSFPFSTNFEDPIYRPTRTPSGGRATSTHACTSVLLSFLAVAASLFLRW